MTLRARGVRLVAALGLAATTACTGSGSSARTAATPTTATTAAPGTAGAISIPFTGQGNAELFLAGDPTGRGAWAWVQAGQGSEVVHLDFSGAVGRVPIDAALAQRLFAGSQGGIAVDRTGGIWLGGGLTLARLDARSGAAELFDLEHLPPSVGMEAPLPANLKGQRVVESVAVTVDGTEVAVGFSGSTHILLYRPSTKTFSTRALPDNTSTGELVFSDAGTLAAGVFTRFTGKNALWVWTPGRAVQQVPVDPLRVGFSSGLFGVAGGAVTLVDPATAASNAWPLPPSGAGAVGVYAGPHDTVFVLRQPSPQVLDRQGRVLETLAMPPGPCGVPSGGGGPGPPPTPPPGGCTMTIGTESAADAAGNVWFVVQGTPYRVGVYVPR